jgi:hypothetical protein
MSIRSNDRELASTLGLRIGRTREHVRRNSPAPDSDRNECVAIMGSRRRRRNERDCRFDAEASAANLGGEFESLTVCTNQHCKDIAPSSVHLNGEEARNVSNVRYVDTKPLARLGQGRTVVHPAHEPPGCTEVCRDVVGRIEAQVLAPQRRRVINASADFAHRRHPAITASLPGSNRHRGMRDRSLQTTNTGSRARDPWPRRKLESSVLENSFCCSLSSLTNGDVAGSRIPSAVTSAKSREHLGAV